MLNVLRNNSDAKQLAQAVLSKWSSGSYNTHLDVLKEEHGIIRTDRFIHTYAAFLESLDLENIVETHINEAYNEWRKPRTHVYKIFADGNYENAWVVAALNEYEVEQELAHSMQVKDLSTLEYYTCGNNDILKYIIADDIEAQNTAEEIIRIHHKQPVVLGYTIEEPRATTQRIAEVVWQSMNQVDETPILRSIYDFWKDGEDTLVVREQINGAVGKTFKVTITEVTE